jgi:uncharacterized membrane protein
VATLNATLKCLIMPAVAAPAIASRLLARANVIIRNAYVMKASTGDIKDADVHESYGVIVALGQKLNAAGATTINAAGMIVLPGLIETLVDNGGCRCIASSAVRCAGASRSPIQSD